MATPTLLYCKNYSSDSFMGFSGILVRDATKAPFMWLLPGFQNPRLNDEGKQAFFQCLYHFYEVSEPSMVAPDPNLSGVRQHFILAQNYFMTIHPAEASHIKPGDLVYKNVNVDLNNEDNKAETAEELKAFIESFGLEARNATLIEIPPTYYGH